MVLTREGVKPIIVAVSPAYSDLFCFAAPTPLYLVPKFNMIYIFYMG